VFTLSLFSFYFVKKMFAAGLFFVLLAVCGSVCDGKLRKPAGAKTEKPHKEHNRKLQVTPLPLSTPHS
jgi:hypothetical protein